RAKQTKIEDTPFILELPPYRLPHAKPLLLKSFQSAKSFVTKAGVVIFAVTFIVWVLGYFPNGAGALETSWLATLGQWIEPVFKPLGVDWRYGVAILASFLAREVFVGTLGTLKGMEAADDDIEGLASRIQSDGLDFASGMGLLVFYAIALQCVSTLAVMKQEIGSNKLVSILIFIAYTALAYSLAITVRLLLL
ncbi:MAG: ferrous iron transporter B, partial [Bacteriovoracaceae bacterium]|nr:ferrous iron transporter B [Bacteriovoracaceae bacterium]